jgi:hypothetical protein
MNQELVATKQGVMMTILVFLAKRQRGRNDLRALKLLMELFIRIKIYVDFWCE